MELTTINNIRERYLSLLSGDARYNHVTQQLAERDKDNPILTPVLLNAEADLDHAEEQRQLSEILLDMHAVNNGITETKNAIMDMVAGLDTHIENILSAVKKQRTQAEDINVLCGKESEYNSIIPVFTSDFGDTDAEILNDQTLGAAITAADKVSYDIVSLNGNGYSGNAFVYNNKEFENETDDRSNLEYILDDNDTTVYEYSRLCTRKKKESVSGVINYDDKEVECVITLAAQSNVCKAAIHSMDTGLLVKKIETSQDGYIFTVHGKERLYINKTEEAFWDPEYVYSGGILCFPYAPYVRLTLASNTVTDDTIAIVDDKGKIKEVNAYRKKISLQGIQLYSASCQEAVVTTGNILEDSSVDRISLFASEYIPDHFTDTDYIWYYLVINGQEYPVVPVNSGRSGTTMIRYSEEKLVVPDTTVLIHETIKTIALKIIIRPYNTNETPYISNLKLCIGKNTGNIYV